MCERNMEMATTKVNLMPTVSATVKAPIILKTAKGTRASGNTATATVMVKCSFQTVISSTVNGRITTATGRELSFGIMETDTRALG